MVETALGWLQKAVISAWGHPEALTPMARLSLGTSTSTLSLIPHSCAVPPPVPHPAPKAYKISQEGLGRFLQRLAPI